MTTALLTAIPSKANASKEEMELMEIDSCDRDFSPLAAVSFFFRGKSFCKYLGKIKVAMIQGVPTRLSTTVVAANKVPASLTL